MNIYTKSKKCLNDLHTPVGAFLSLRDRYASVSVFESSAYHSKVNSKSFIGIDPIIKLSVENKTLTTEIAGNLRSTPCRNIQSLTEAMSTYVFTDASTHNTNGFFGLFGHAAVQLFEDIKIREDESLPTIHLVVYQYVIVFDHYHNQLQILQNSLRSDEIDSCEDVLHHLKQVAYPTEEFEVGPEKSPDTDASFMAKIDLAKAHIKNGDVFQLVLSRQFYRGFEGDDFEVYRQLRSSNPSPYMFYFDTGKARLIGASPEAQFIVEKGKASIHPIAGTVRKSENEAINKAKIESLIKNKKENAEHNMLVDLARNDLNRNCTGVELVKEKEVQAFSHVYHLVSEVKGKLSHTNVLKAFGDSFPAGTLTGAPKHKAMQLIDQYETVTRGFYGGAIGIFHPNGNINSAIIIRSLLAKDHQIYYQAGAGIVFDSTPEGENQEVYNKIGSARQAILKALRT